MNKTIDADITIVGAGVIGASLALALAGSTRLKIALIDTNVEQVSFEGEEFDPRVMALSPASLGFLDKIGAWQDILATRACPYYSMEVWDGEGTRGNVKFDCRDSHDPYLGYIVENSVLLKALWQQITSQPRIQFFTGFKVNGAEAGRVCISSVIEPAEKRNISLASQLIIAADGARSIMRQHFAVAMREWDYHQYGIVCSVRSELSHEFTCRQRFTKSGPIAFLPLCVDSKVSSGQHYSSLVWSVDEGEASYIMSLSDEAFCNRLGAEFESALGEIQHASERFSFPLRQRHASDYVKPGFALVGDAAHTIHPLAGQGANLGFADIAALLEEIQRSLSRKIPLDHFSVLQRYQRRRKSHNLATMAVMEGFKHLFASDDLAIRWLRNTGMQAFNSQFWLKQRVTEFAAGRL